jgi:Uma2 family endonuclease
MGTKTALTLDEFLALPETEPASEYIDGEVVQKVAPSWYHASLVHELGRLIGNYVVQHPGEGRVVTELRHAFRGAAPRVYVPDLGVLRVRNVPRDRRQRTRGPVEVPPDFAIEVLSPGDYPGRVLEKADFYMRACTELLWIGDPELESVTVYKPGEAPAVVRAPHPLDAAPVLPGLAIDLAQLFAILRQDEDPE